MKQLAIVLCSGVLAMSAAAEEAKLIMESAAGGLPEGIDGFDKPNGYKYGAKLTFLVEGQNFIRFDNDSLKAEGWELEPFAKASKSGETATFTIHKKGNYIGKLSSLKVKGEVVLVTGNKSESKTFKATKKSEKDIGPFKVKLKIEGKKWGDGVHIDGPLDDIKSVTIKIDGKTLKSNGYSGGFKGRTYSFEKIKDNVDVTIEYWAGTEEKVITFSK